MHRIEITKYRHRKDQIFPSITNDFSGIGRFTSNHYGFTFDCVLDVK